MSFWSVMNYVAWILSGLIVLFFITDFIKIEKNRSKDEK